ncbi:MAG TPA: HAD-IC family P-type ATPase [Rubrobacteraceae bacterium]|nr:HAD-IC family P-type ATPase [Rubrobacteraceae bacterium]
MLSAAEAAARSAEELLETLESSAQKGLSSGEARRRLEELGPNVLDRASGEGVWKILWRQVNDPLIWVLLASSVLALLLGETVDAFVVLAVVVLNTIIGFVQEYRASKEIEALVDLVPRRATVLRDGERVAVSADDLVPGDVVLLAAGDQVPADARVLSSKSLQVDESALTGESVPVEKGTEPVEDGSEIGGRTGVVHGGTLATYGRGTAVIFTTGSGTEIGRISSMLGEATEVETPLTRQISVFSKWLTVAIVVVAVLLFPLGLLREFPTADALLAAIALAVAAIPEGLPAIITIALAVGVRRMAGRRAIIRRLPAVETLGSTTVINTDKTGTLTRNEMTVKELWTPREGSHGEAGGAYALDGAGYDPEGELLDLDGNPVDEVPDDLVEMVRAGLLCNDATINDGEDGRTVAGDPTEGALIVAAEKLGLDVGETRRRFRRVDSVPFESERRYMATLNDTPGGERRVYLKGAPGVVLERCDTMTGGAPLDGEAVLGEVERMSSGGMRVLALASKPALGLDAVEETGVQDGFVFLGLVGMTDPPREEAIEAIAACHDAGITVKMITGDYAGTAAAIGRQVGLIGEHEMDGAMTGRELDRLSDDELREAAARTNVFARVAPEHKIRLVRALQENGEIAAMTGDGVNDAPALKQADIGVAMGITGTDVSKESADVVLTDDNFATIAAAVEEGRRVYDNLRKALAFLLPTNLGEALIILLAVAFFPVTAAGQALLPIQPVQILWINLVAAVALGLPLAFEAREPDIMSRPPLDPKRQILDRFLLFRTVVVGLLMAAGAIGLFILRYFGSDASSGDLGGAQTEAVTTVILFQIFYLLECRSLRGSSLKMGLFSNRWIYVGIGAILVLQLGFVYLPFMNVLFGSAPLGPTDWMWATLAALVVLPVVEVEKWWRERRYRRRIGRSGP